MNPETGPTAVPTDGEWECMECGYVAAGAKARRPAQCPDCGAPAKALEFFSYGDDDGDASADEPGGSLYDEDEDDDVLDDDDERLGAGQTRFVW